MSMVAVVMVMDHVHGDDYDGDKYECDDYNGGGTFGWQDMECLNTKTFFLPPDFVTKILCKVFSLTTSVGAASATLINNGATAGRATRCNALAALRTSSASTARRLYVPIAPLNIVTIVRMQHRREWQATITPTTIKPPLPRLGTAF